MPLNKTERIGYVTKTFPTVTTTFELNEIIELENSGISVSIFSLGLPFHTILHTRAEGFSKKTIYPSRLFPVEAISLIIYFLVLSPKRFFLTLLSHFTNYVFPYHYHEATLFIKSLFIARVAKEKQLQHINASFCSEATTSAMIVSKLLGIPFSFTARAIDIYVYSTKKQLAQKIKDASFVVTESKYNKKYLSQLCDSKFRDKVHVIYTGYDFNQEKQFIGKRKDRYIIEIVSVGRLIEKKGLSYLIRACSLLKSKGHDFRCRIIGEGHGKPQLEDLINRQGLDDKVHLVPYMEANDLKVIYAETDIFVLPSVVAENGDRDGIPNVLVEAMAMAVPVVSTNVSGIPELVDDGENGSLVSERDVDSLADAMEMLIVNKELREKMGAKGREKVKAKFNIKKNMGEFIKLLENN